MSKTSPLAIMSYTAIVASILLLLAILFSLLYPFKTSDLTNLKVVTLKNSLRNGHLATVSFDYCKYTSSPADFSVELVPMIPGEMSLVYQLQSGKVNSPKGCHKTIKRLTIPCEVPDGDYKIRLTLVYEINPIRTIARVFETDNFVRVVQRKEK
jgi:hypothetical protein